MPSMSPSLMARIDDRLKEFFSYTTPAAGVTLPAAAGSQAIQTVQITQEADFYCTKVIGTDTDAAGEFFTVLMTTSETDRQFMNAGVHKANFQGTAQLPRLLPMPRVFYRNSTITLTYTRVIAAAAPSLIWTSFEGYKVFFDLSRLNLTANVGR